MTTKIKLPEGDVEFASKEEKFWMDVKEGIEKRLKAFEDSVKIEKAVLEMVDGKIKKEAV